MKRIIKTSIAMIIALATVFSVVSCSSGNTKTYEENGLVYTLPKDMRLGSVPEEIADTYYLNDDGVEFFIYFISEETLRLYYYLTTCTPEEYATAFIADMGYKDVTTYVDPSGYVIFYHTYTSDVESDFYYEYVIRNEETLYHVTMCCDPEDVETYKPIFEEWAKKIHLKK